VQASNDTRLWGPVATTAAIAVAPRFYQTRWFVAVSVLAVGLLILGGVFKRSLAVLLAEDGAVNQLLVKRLLERAGHFVTVVDSGAQAVEAFARSPYDVVLMDLQMPDMDGLEATMSIRARETNGRRVPVIALTAHAMGGDRERCLAAGMDGYLSKPIRADALLASLAEHTGTACETPDE